MSHSENWEIALLEAGRKAKRVKNFVAMNFFYDLLDSYKVNKKLSERQIQAFYKFWDKMK